MRMHITPEMEHEAARMWDEESLANPGADT